MELRRRAREAGPGTKILVCIGLPCGCSPSPYKRRRCMRPCSSLRLSPSPRPPLSRGRHRMGVPPLSDPLTAVGVEAPALTANVSHIPGLEPVLRRFRSVLPGRWTVRKSVSLTTGSSVSCATRIHYCKIDRSCLAGVCLGVDELRSTNSFECLTGADKRIPSACALSRGRC